MNLMPTHRKDSILQNETHRKESDNEIEKLATLSLKMLKIRRRKSVGKTFNIIYLVRKDFPLARIFRTESKKFES